MIIEDELIEFLEEHEEDFSISLGNKLTEYINKKRILRSDMAELGFAVILLRAAIRSFSKFPNGFSIIESVIAFEKEKEKEKEKDIILNKQNLN